MITKDHPIYKSMVARATDAVNALWEDFAETKETLTPDNDRFLSVGELGDQFVFYFEHKSTCLAVNYSNHSAEILERLRNINEWENIIPALTIKVISDTEVFFGSAILEALNADFEIKQTFTKAYQGDFISPPFDKVNICSTRTITDLPKEQAIVLLTALQLIGYLTDVEISSIINVQTDEDIIDIIFGTKEN